MGASKDFHILVSAKAREGTYQVRLYSVPIASEHTLNGMDYHYQQYVKARPAVTLDSKVLQTIGPQQVDAESELEQGNPRFASMQVDLLADPALQVVIENMRDPTKDIWCEITLFQNVEDAAPPPLWANLVWPRQEKLYFWGYIDRKSSKGTVNTQRFTARDEVVRQDNHHNGIISFVFFHWVTFSNFQDVKSLLDAHSPFGNTTLSAADIMLGLMSKLAPTPSIFVCDQEMNKPQRYVNVPSLLYPFNFPIGGSDGSWGRMSITIKPADGTPTTNLKNVYVDASGLVSGTLWGYGPPDGPPQTHTLTSDQDSTSLYHWNNMGQALTEWCREFFFTWQCELPTLAQAYLAKTTSVDDPALLGYSARFLLLDISTTAVTGKPLTIALNPLEGTIEYDPCGAWATSYTVSEPMGDDRNPNPAQTVASSQFPGGSDESYQTLLRLCGWNYVAGLPTQNPSGWDISVPDHTGIPKLAITVVDNDTTTSFSEAPGNMVSAWSAVHAFKKIARWGSPRAILTLTSRGVGLEPWGQSAIVHGKAFTPPKLTYGLYDFSDFPLGRRCLALPGILATPGDDAFKAIGEINAIGFSTISVKRTPNGDTEVKLIEVLGNGDQFPLPTQVAPPPSPPPPPPPPPPPRTTGGTPDTPSITGVLIT